MANYATGQQPCKDFKARREANAYATWDNCHECFGKDRNGKFCGKTVSWCENCGRDHHAGGYETCCDGVYYPSEAAAPPDPGKEAPLCPCKVSSSGQVYRQHVPNCPSAKRFVLVATGEGASAAIADGELHEAIHKFICCCGKNWKLCEASRDDVLLIDDPDEWNLDEGGDPFSVTWEHETGSIGIYRLSEPAAAPVPSPLTREEPPPIDRSTRILDRDTTSREETKAKSIPVDAESISMSCKPDALTREELQEAELTAPEHLPRNYWIEERAHRLRAERALEQERQRLTRIKISLGEPDDLEDWAVEQVAAEVLQMCRDKGVKVIYLEADRLQLRKALEAIIESASDGRAVPEWLTERLVAARAALRGETK